MDIYNAELSAGSLLLPESRRVAKLLLTHPTKDAWNAAIGLENILQKKSLATARRQAKLIRNRLETLDERAWELVATGDQEIASQILFACAVKHSRLLSDFLRDVVVGRLRKLETTLSPRDWDAFMVECAQRDPKVVGWSPSTKAKLLQVIVRMLAEARYLESTRSLKLRVPHLHPLVEHFLTSRHENVVLAAMELKS